MMNLGYGINGYVVKKIKNGRTYAKKVIKLTDEENENMELVKINDVKYPYPRTFLELNWMINNKNKDKLDHKILVSNESQKDLKICINIKDDNVFIYKKKIKIEYI